MAYRIINIAVLRIPMIKYVVEQYTVDSVFIKQEDVMKSLKDDKNVLDFYII